MTSPLSRSGRPGVRFGWSLAASLALHLVLLLPASVWLRQRPPPPAVPLEVSLPPPEAAVALATQPEPEPPAPAAAPPAPTSAQPAPRSMPPRKLEGRALETALAALSREEFYPRAAIERGLEGRVVLLLTLAESGRVTGVEVAGSSGHAMLDAAAVKAAGRIGALPGGGRQALLPVEFRLE